MSAKEWESVYCLNQIYKRSDRNYVARSYDIISPNECTQVFHRYFFEQTRKSCPIVYKYAKLFPYGTEYLKLVGHCSSCNSILKGSVLNRPETCVTINCNYIGSFNKCNSGKKRRLIGKKRDEYLNKLVKQNTSSSHIKRTEANQLMNFGECEPSHLPSINALRVMKYKYKKNNQLHCDPIMTLSILKRSTPYDKIIKNIGYDVVTVLSLALDLQHSTQHSVVTKNIFLK